MFFAQFEAETGNFLNFGGFQPQKFLKNFLNFREFQPRVSYKGFLINKLECMRFLDINVFAQICPLLASDLCRSDFEHGVLGLAAESVTVHYTRAPFFKVGFF